MKTQQKYVRSGVAFALAATLWATSALAAPLAFRAPAVPAQPVSLEAPLEKAAPAPTGGKLRVGDVRALAKSASAGEWVAVPGGYVARIRARSAGALGLRVRLDLGTVPGAMEVRVQGSDASRLESMVVDPLLGTEAWTPWTEGDTQLLEVFSPVAPSSDAVRVGAVVHFTASPFAKAAASCTISTACTAGDAALDAAIAERKKSVARINFIDGAVSYICTLTLIDTPRNPAAYAITANHCVGGSDAAGTIQAYWFYEAAGCNVSGTNPGFVQTSGGAQLVFTNPAVDSTLLLFNQSPPAGVTYAPLNTNLVADAASVVSISHPEGDTSRWAAGTMLGRIRVSGIPGYDTYFVEFTRGLIQGGSSGSGMFTSTGSGLALAGVLSLGPIDESCTGTDNKFGVYDRIEVLYPQMAQYIGAASPGPDDAPNQIGGATTAVTASPIDTLSQPAVSIQGRIDYAGDVDVYRFTVSREMAVSVFTQGTQDTVGTILDVNGHEVETNDDGQLGDTNSGITHVLAPGTYYYQVAHWTPTGTGNYTVVMRADRVDTNYTALWWNPQESGWGINLDHQGDILFATLFTYDESGAPMWLVMSRGDRQSDGSYSGALYRTTGPAFNTVPWTQIALTQVGTMRLVFDGRNDATLTYSYNGRSVGKQITRQVFKTLPECSWSIFDRSFASNVQDLWWNPQESGWGINFAHQDETIFATLFTYDAAGRGLWLVMSNGVADSAGVFQGTLYRTRGPAFDAQPWTSITLTPVGAMSVDFANGNSATLNYTVDGIAVTKSIQRQVFSSPKTKCES